MSSRVQAIRSGGYQIDFKFSPKEVGGKTIYIVVASLTKEKNAIGRAETFYGISLYEDTGKQIKGSKWWRWRYLMSSESFKLGGKGERNLLCRAFSHAWREGGVAGDKTEALGEIKTLLGHRKTSRIFSKKGSIIGSAVHQISARRDALLEVFLTAASVRLDPARSAGVHSVLEILREIIEIVDKYIPAEDWEKHLRKVLKIDSRPLSFKDLTGIDKRFDEYEEREHAEKKSELEIFAHSLGHLDPDRVKQEWNWKARDEVPGKKQWLDNLNELRRNNQSAPTYQFEEEVTRQILAHGKKSRTTERIKCMPKARDMLESQEHVKIWFGLVAQASDVQKYTHFTDYLTAMTLDEKVEFANRKGAPAVSQMVMEDKRDEGQLRQKAKELSGKADAEALERAFEEGEVISAEELRRLDFSALERMALQRGIAQSAIDEAIDEGWTGVWYSKAALVALLVAVDKERVKQESSPEKTPRSFTLIMVSPGLGGGRIFETQASSLDELERKVEEYLKIDEEISICPPEATSGKAKPYRSLDEIEVGKKFVQNGEVLARAKVSIWPKPDDLEASGEMPKLDDVQAVRAQEPAEDAAAEPAEVVPEQADEAEAQADEAEAQVLAEKAKAVAEESSDSGLEPATLREQHGSWGGGAGGGRIPSKKRIRKSTKRKKRKKIKNTKRKNTRRKKRKNTKRKNTKRKILKEY